MSIIFDKGSYSNCKDNGAIIDEAEHQVKYCPTAEILTEDADRHPITNCSKSTDQNGITGWATPDELAKIMACVAKGAL